MPHARITDSESSIFSLCHVPTQCRSYQLDATGQFKRGIIVLFFCLCSAGLAMTSAPTLRNMQQTAPCGAQAMLRSPVADSVLALSTTR
jgi:hypothetical protein